MSHPVPASPDWKFRLELLGVAITAAVAIVVVLAVVPVDHTFSERVSSQFFTPGTTTVDLPHGSPVSGGWASVDGSSVTFQIVNSQNFVVYSSTGSNGSFDFSATDPPYTFEASSGGPETVAIWGIYSSPAL